MRITCLITVCAYLSSTVSTDEIQYFNRRIYIACSRLTRTRLQEQLAFNDAARKEINPNIGIRPYVFSTSQISRPQEQIETLQKPFHRKVRESQFRPQQQHARSRPNPMKRLKIRSIAGYSEVLGDDNEVHEFIHGQAPEEKHGEGPIYIKPVVRVTKKNIFDSIVDILEQLLNPPKKELGPIVGPIKMPGSHRKIYLRLMEPVDEKHIKVRFVTEVPVPVVDEKSILGPHHETVFPFLPFVDPADALLHRHPAGSSDATFSSSNRHPSVQLPRNATRVSGKGQREQFRPPTKPKKPTEDLQESNNENVPPVKVAPASGAESDKNHLYYHYQTEDDAVKQVTEIIREEQTKHEQNSKEPWYQLTTHRLPLRQVAPLYPLSAMEHTDSTSYENTYKVPSDSLTVPSQYTSSYEQYSNANAASGEIYDQSYTVPNAYQKQNEFSNAPSSYSISYQNQNEFNNAPSPTSYVKQNDLFSAPTTYASSYEETAYVPPSPASTHATFHEAQNGADAQAASNSQNALRVIEPPAYFPDPRQVLGNPNIKYENPATPRQRYNLSNANVTGSLPRDNTQNNGEILNDQVIWGKVKRERSESNFQMNESNFQKSVEITPDDNRDKWQPLMFVPEDADWHKAFTNLAKVANGNQHETIVTEQQSIDRPRQQVSRSTTPSTTTERERVGARRNSKRRNPSVAATTQSSKCLTADKGDKCERAEPLIAPTPYPEQIVEKQVQSVVNVEPVLITPKSIASSTVESVRLNVTKSSWIVEPQPLNDTKSSWTVGPQPLVMTTDSLATNSTTEKPALLIKMIKSTTAKSVENKTTTRSKSNSIEKSLASSTTQRSLITDTSEASVSNNTTKRLRLPKRPMIMKKPTFVLKGGESNSTTRKASTTTRKASTTTRKPITSSTTERTKMTRRSKYHGENRGAISKTKSSTI
ncbi:uncharacterized protein LOC114254286 [Monomorium pharaonis]|uniref:uncharacterized protein LOC114254286 n=1 Tax=Monomorium pharaonis TaxID=307658 RepID=UPI001747D61C|nr:uncharacterized protein LOC114254286 [Monomorium pharaonis]